jgi:hypothetical protein
MPLSPEEQAQIMAQLAPTPMDSVAPTNVAAPYTDAGRTPGPGFMQPGSISDQVARGIAPLSPTVMRGLQYPGVNKVMLGSVLGPAGPVVANAATPSADGALSGLNSNAKRILSFDPKTGGESLKEMNTPLANVQAAPTLNMPQVGRGAGGFGGGGSSGISDALAAYRASQQKQVGLMDKEADLQSEKGVATADRIEAVATKEEEQAARQEAMVQEQARIQSEADQHTTAFMNQTMKMNDDLANAKVDRRRIFKDMSTGDSVMMGMAGALAGMMQGLQGRATNSFMDYVERRMDADVNDQMKEFDNKRATVSARQNMFGQLLQQSGNRNVASMQLMNMQLEAMKQQTAAFASKSGIPEVLKSSDQARNMIEQKQAELQKGIAGEYYKTKVAEAQAAAAARAAAEEKAHQRQIELIKLGQEQDKINIEREKVSGTSTKAVDEKVEKLGNALGAADMAKGRESLDRLATQLEKTKKGDHLEGLGMGSKVVKALPGGQHLVSDQANINEQDWNAILGVYSNIRTGSGGSDAEAKKILKEAEGANTPAERANFIRKMQADFQRREDAFRAAAGPEASAKYDANKAANKATMPGSVQVTQPSGPVNQWTGRPVK